MDGISKDRWNFRLMCHLVFVCKYRKKLTILLRNDVKQFIYDIADRCHFKSTSKNKAKKQGLTSTSLKASWFYAQIYKWDIVVPISQMKG
jgi:hypothetical protein